MAEETETTLPPVERDTYDLALRTAPDPFLGDLIELAQHGTELAVGLLVNGMIIIGRLDRDEAIAGALSQMRRRLIDRSPKPDDHSDEQWDAVREGFTNGPLQYVADRRALEQAVVEQLGEHATDGVINVDELPIDLARTSRETSTRAHLTLTDVRVAAPGQDGMTALPVMRVATRHITSWWFAMPNEDGSSNIELWAANRTQ